MHSTALHCAAAGAVLAQLSPLAVLNNNGFTRKLQVQATLLQAAAAAERAAAARAAGATGAEDQIPKKSTSLFVWHCNIRVSAGFGREPAVFGLWLGLDGPFSAGCN